MKTLAGMVLVIYCLSYVIQGMGPNGIVIALCIIIGMLLMILEFTEFLAKSRLAVENSTTEISKLKEEIKKLKVGSDPPSS